MNIPVIRLESDYNEEDVEQLRKARRPAANIHEADEERECDRETESAEQ